MLSKYKGVWSKYKVFIPLLVAKIRSKKYLPRTKFIILSRSRTGSMMLINYLRKVPKSYVHSELMGRKFLIPFWRRIPDLVYGYRSAHYDIAGFKYFYYHPVDDWDSNNFIFEYIFSHPDIKVIHWTREDLFAVILSRYIAVQTGKWAKTKKESEKIEEFSIDENIFKYELEKTLSQIAAVRSLFSSYENYFELTYEDIVKRNRLLKLFDFLGVENTDIVHQANSSQRSESKYQFITNVASLRAIYNERMRVMKSENNSKTPN